MPSKLWHFDVNQKKLFKKNMDATRHSNKMLFWFKKLHKHPINILKLLYNTYKYLYFLFTNRNNCCFYLKGGTYELINTLINHPLWNNVLLIKSKCTDISPVSSTDDSSGMIVALDNGEKIHVNKVVMTLGCDINISRICRNFPSIFKHSMIKQHDFKSLQILIFLKHNKKKLAFTSFIYDNKNSYIGGDNFLVKKRINYISDITEYTENTNKINLRKRNLSIIALAVDSKCYINNDSTVDTKKLLYDLKRFNLISDESIIYDIHTELIKGKMIDTSSLDVFHSFRDRFEILQ